VKRLASGRLWRRAALGALAAGICLLAPAPTGAGASTSPYLLIAERGAVRAERLWRDPRLGWYDERLYDHDRYPLATIWGAVPLFETLDAIDIASPTPAHRSAVASFADGAERYFDRALGRSAGYAPYPGDRGRVVAWFDDNGWWGLAFMDAYRATGSARYLKDAERAFGFIAAQGWDPTSGGLWWNTSHPYKAGEALASGTLLGAMLYRETGRAFYLSQVQRFLGWADGHMLTEDGLFALSSVSAIPAPYVEGPLIEAYRVLCEAGVGGDCARAGELAEAARARFEERLTMGPQFDTIYLHWMLLYSAQTGTPWWARLARNMARRAEQHAVEPDGLYLRAWDGSPITRHQAAPGMLQTDAATLELFAWLAVSEG